MQALDNDTDILMFLDFEPEDTCKPANEECDRHADWESVWLCCGWVVPLCTPHKEQGEKWYAELSPDSKTICGRCKTPGRSRFERR
jgi:hypothetical protein